ncbi:cell wall-binding repeat-containing protein [Oryzobacter sp. R7]|uniref:cell wall-binding repeat-containing protein n=1 Tax=Oryzobacter faecalis TaxID=3388656 RepID=UPI00398CBB7C
MATVAVLGVSTGLAATPATAAPPAPVITLPTAGADSATNPVLGWSAVSGALRYVVQVATQDDFASGAVKFSATTANTYATPVADLAVGEYWWRVAGIDGTGATGTYATSTFTKVTANQPVPQTPADGQELQYPNDALVLSWAPLAGARTYEVQIDDDPGFVGAAGAVSTTNTSYTPVMPPFGTTAYWRVRAKSTQGVPTQYSDARSYRVVWPTPISSAPADRSPANTTSPTVEEVVLDWKPLAGASSYQLQISPDEFFNNPIGGTLAVNSTRYSPNPTLPAGSYYWRVRGMSTASSPEPGAWSTPWVFTRAWPAGLASSRPRGTESSNAFNQVVLTSPADADYTLTEPVLTWQPQREAATYQVDIGTDVNFSPLTFDTCYTNHTIFSPYAHVEGDGSGCNPVKLDPGQVMYWRVRALDGTVNGVYSTTRSFLYDPTRVVPVAPADGSTVSVPVLKWTPVDNIAKYKVSIAPVTPVAGCSAVTAITYNTTYVPEALSLLCTGQMRWTVQSMEDDTELSRLPAIADWWTFTVTPPSSAGSMGTVTTTPLDGVHPPLMTWTPRTSATKYTIFVSVAGAGSYTAANIGTNRSGFSYTGENTTWPDLLLPGSYTFYVNAYDASNNLLETSPVGSFTISSWPTAQLQTPKCQAGVVCTLHDTPRLDWLPIANAGSYLVYLAKDPNFTNIERVDRTAVSELNYLDSLADSQAGESYYWYVRPCGGAVCGPFDTSVFPLAGAFRKESLPVEALSPKKSGATPPVVTDEVTFTWKDYLATNFPLDGQTPIGSQVPETVTQEASSYTVEVSTTAEFTQVIDTKTGIDQTTYTPQLTTYPDGPLFWRVRAFDASGNPLTWSCVPGTSPRAPQPACSDFAFTKTSTPPTLVTPSSGSAVDRAPALSWLPMPYARTYEVEVYSNPAQALNPANRVVLMTTRQTAAIANTSLPAGDYGWRARRVDTNARPGAWTTDTNTGLRLFTVAGTPPALVKPAAGATVADNAVLFEWGAVAGVSRFRVDVSKDSFTTTLATATTDMTAWAPVLAARWAAGQYQWRVTALDAAGLALATSATRTFSILTPPGPPTAVTATAGAAQAVVSWTAPVNTGGSTITGYRVTSSPGGITATTSGQTTATVTGLTNGTTYTFTVVAINAQGESVSSAASNGVKPLGAPAAPAAPTVAPGDSQATVSWTAPANGGSPITKYTVKAEPGGRTATTTGATSVVVTGLTNGTAYTFTVTATNAIGTSPPSPPSAAATPGSKLAERWAGSDRFSSSAVFSSKSYAPGVAVAYVANGMNFPDALSGAPIAGKTGGPVLLTQADALPTVIKTELSRLKPLRIVVLGGTGAVSAGVASQLDAYTTGAVERWAGSDRFSSSAVFSSKSYATGVPVAYVANGLNFPDALSGAPIAGKTGGPVLLTQAGSLPTVIKTELARLKPQRIVVLGGIGAVSSSVATQLDGYTTGAVERWAGSDRFSSSAVFSAKSYAAGVPVVYVANGLNFPDALSGAPIAGKSGGPVLLTQADSLPTVIKQELARLKPKRIVVLGGTGAVSASVQQQLSGYLGL